MNKRILLYRKLIYPWLWRNIIVVDNFNLRQLSHFKLTYLNSHIEPSSGASAKVWAAADFVFVIRAIMRLLLDIEVGGGMRHGRVTKWFFCTFWDKMALHSNVLKCLEE